MRQFQFPLEPVLGVKRSLKKRAEQHWLSATKQLRVLEQTLDDLHRQLHGVAHWMGQEHRQHSAAATWHGHHLFSRHVHRQMERLRAKILDQQRACQLRKQEAEKLATEVEALMTLRQQAWEEHRREAERAAQWSVDDFMLRQYSQQQPG